MSKVKIPTMSPIEILPQIRIDTLVSAFTVSRGEGYIFPGESHDFWEMVYISEGTAGITAGSKILKCRAGSLIFHKPNEFHRIWNAGKKELEFTVVSFNAKGEYINKMFNKVLMLDKKGIDALNTLRSEIESNGPDSNYMPQKFRSDKEKAAKFTVFLEYLLYEFSKYETNIEPNTVGNAALFTAAVKIMNKNVDKPLKAKQIADELNISLSQLKRIFNRYALKGIHQYFLDLKITTAKEMLERGESVYNTALAVGFYNQNNFSSTFKKLTGLSPSKWAKENREE